MPGRRSEQDGDQLSALEAALVVVTITAAVVLLVLVLGFFAPTGT